MLSSQIMLKRLHISKNDSSKQNKFFLAARGGNLADVLKYLNKKNIDINTCNTSGLNALHLASKGGHFDVVAELIRRGADINATTERGNTAIHFAAFAGHYEIVRKLVERGANVNLLSQEKFSPLYMAAQENHAKIVQFLLSNGADQSLASQDGFTALEVAIQQRNDGVVACLLENESGSKQDYPSALHVAAKNDYVRAAKLLAEKGHSVNVPSKRGFTPLHVAAHYGNVGIGKLLIENKADINFQSNTGISPLHVGCSRGKSEIVSVLVDSGVDVASHTSDGLTPLHCAAKSGCEQEVGLLLQTGAPVVARTNNGLSPLHMAIQGDHENCADIMLSHNAPINDTTKDGLNPLHIAAYYGHLKSAKFLLSQKCDLNAKTTNGLTPLHIACQLNHAELAKLLLEYGAKSDPVSKSGLTPTHIAASMGLTDIIEILLKNGANTNAATTPKRETPLHLAASAHHTEAIRKLISGCATRINPRDKFGKTPLHIASELGNMDDVELLMMPGAKTDFEKKAEIMPEKIIDECLEKEASILPLNEQPLKAEIKNEETFTSDLPNEMENAAKGIISKAELSLADVAYSLGSDWLALGKQLGLTQSELEEIECQQDGEQGFTMLNNWIKKNNNAVSGNDLERALHSIGRDDVIDQSIHDIEEVTDPEDKAIAMAYINAIAEVDPGIEYELEEIWDGTQWKISLKSIPESGLAKINKTYQTDESPKESPFVADEEDVMEEHLFSLCSSRKNNYEDDVKTGNSVESEEETFDDGAEFWSEAEESEDDSEYEDVIEADVSRESEDSGLSDESTRVLLRKRVHKKTVITGNQEETIVTEDTQIDQLNDIPVEIQKAVLQFADLFLLNEMDFDPRVLSA